MRPVDRAPSRRTAAAVAAAALTALALVGCGAEPPGGAGSSAGAGTATSPAAGATELTGPIEYHRVGGIGGLQDGVVLQPDGTYTVTRKGGATETRTASPQQLSAIAAAVQKADLATLPTGSPDSTVADELYTKLAVDGRTYRIASTQTPPQVRPLLAELDALLSSPAATP